MGTWGTGISSNDMFEDINHEFFELYNDGLEVDAITSQLITENKELIEADTEERNSFWFSVALAQWECKALDPTVFQKVQSIVASGDDIKLWEELGASTAEQKKRKKVLDQFLEKLATEKKVAKKPKKKILRNAIYEKGDCLTFRLNSGNYGGALVLESEKQTEGGMNLIAVTDIDSNFKPTIDEFEMANVLTEKKEVLRREYRYREMVSWYQARLFKKSRTEFEVVGQIEVSRLYNFENDYRSFAHWDLMPELLNRNSVFFIEERGESEHAPTLEKLRK
ncbi:hypothetical protein [Pontibacter pamirensis]|uniref:hypothetical protein n=1 Tax=Pontibacter pamirensis TaxID=2562824 RepID=UPI00138A53BC|nr:hypothetical protein [Pontibacter pamirensis]